MDPVDLKLPFPEEIYDLDSFELNEEYQRIKEGKQQLEGIKEPSDLIQKKLRKCRKIMEMMELEI